jgi:hypothetical protein
MRLNQINISRIDYNKHWATKYDGINRTAPSFLMIDIELKDLHRKINLIEL